MVMTDAMGGCGQIDSAEAAKRLWTPESQTIALREWADFFRKSYKKAKDLAK